MSPHAAPTAVRLLAALDEEDTVLLWQVACEVGAVVSRMARNDRSMLGTVEVVQSIRNRFPLVLPRPEVLDAGLRLQRDRQISYWDAILIAACLDAGVTRLYTEDVPGHNSIEQLEIVNPFAA